MESEHAVFCSHCFLFLMSPQFFESFVAFRVIVLMAVLFVLGQVDELAFAQSLDVDFGRDIQPILEGLSDEERATLLRWAQQGADLPEDLLLGESENEALHGAALFEFEIAPILATHCLECHDTSRKEGALDLSRKRPAFKGGDSGVAIHPGDGENSELWKLVESGDMPEDRPALSVREKGLLKRWMDEGADWSVDWIDPAIYENEGGGGHWVRRLTVREYIDTVKASVGVDIEGEALDVLPEDLRADGFNNTAYNLNVDMGHVSAYAELAASIVEKMDTLSFAKRFHKKLLFTDKEMGNLIEKMGTWLLRGPLELEEVIAFRGISTTVASSGGSLSEAVGYILEAMLQSPRFIYRIEKQQSPGSNPRVSDYELASRLSYGIWGSSPDEKLMNAASEDELSDKAVLAQHIDRMLIDSRAVDRSLQFAYEWLDLGRMESLSPDSEKFPEWNSKLASDMCDETLAVFRDVVWDESKPLSHLLNTQKTFLTPELAEHYGLKRNRNSESEGEMAPYDLSPDPSRGGLLTQGSILSIGGDDASMVTRGLFVLHDLLRGTVKDPPPGLDTTPVPSSPGQSQRVIAEQRIADNSCGGCHSKFEPLAFGLERFDGLGGYAKRDVFKNRLRQDGEILFPGDVEAKKYKTSKELMDLLAGSDRVSETITWKLVQFVMGRPLGARDAIAVKAIHESAQTNGGTYQSLMRAIGESDLVRKVSS
ncbi:MAG: DUF1592 domain-containing protein [Opitutales bacterium]|nr:DUF1592 domain-containing protein [Opitutales bacterium]